VRIAVVHDAVGEASRADERDVLLQAATVEAALAAQGHAPLRVAAGLDLEALAASLRRLRPDLVFNLVESLAGAGRLIHLVPALLDRLGLAYTGAPTEALFLATHKVLAKRWLRQAGLPPPPWQEPQGPPAAAAPRWIVKPVWEDASVGIDDRSVVAARAADLPALLDAEARRLGCEVFAEAYVEGREFNLSLLAKAGDVEVLPAAEIDFRDFPPGKPRIVGYAAKWQEGSFEHEHTPRRFDLPPADAGLVARLEELAAACWRLFGLAGYARVDFRVDAEGAPWILEVNPNPCLSPDAGLLAAAARANCRPGRVVERIVAAALERARLRSP
jgi:D-alanine-D-alanine ligase